MDRSDKLLNWSIRLSQSVYLFFSSKTGAAKKEMNWVLFHHNDTLLMNKSKLRSNKIFWRMNIMLYICISTLIFTANRAKARHTESIYWHEIQKQKRNMQKYVDMHFSIYAIEDSIRIDQTVTHQNKRHEKSLEEWLPVVLWYSFKRDHDTAIKMQINRAWRPLSPHYACAVKCKQTCLTWDLWCIILPQHLSSPWLYLINVCLAKLPDLRRAPERSALEPIEPKHGMQSKYTDIRYRKRRKIYRNTWICISVYMQQKTA